MNSANQYTKSISVEPKSDSKTTKETNLDEIMMKNLNMNTAVIASSPPLSSLANHPILQLGSVINSSLPDSNLSPTQVNMLTVSFPMNPQQRQKISERNYRFRESRRNSYIDKQSNSKRRSSQQKEFNNSLSSSTGSNILNKNEPQQRQRTLDSVYDVMSNDCMILFSHL